MTTVPPDGASHLLRPPVPCSLPAPIRLSTRDSLSSNHATDCQGHRGSAGSSCKGPDSTELRLCGPCVISIACSLVFIFLPFPCTNVETILSSRPTQNKPRLDPAHYNPPDHEQRGSYGFETGGQFSRKTNPRGLRSRAIFSVPASVPVPWHTV